MAHQPDESSDEEWTDETLSWENIDPELLDTFGDIGLLMVICVKLEAVLTEVLAQYCHLNPADSPISLLTDSDSSHPEVHLIDYYLQKYDSKHVSGSVQEDSVKSFSEALKTSSKMTFGQLIYNVFQNKDGNPATYWDFSSEEFRFTNINNLRPKVAHCSKHTDPKKILGDLSAPERKKIVSYFIWIVKNSRTFQKAYPDTDAETHDKRQKDFLEVKKLKEFKTLVRVYNQRVNNTDKEIDEIKEAYQLLLDKMEKNQKEIDRLESTKAILQEKVKEYKENLNESESRRKSDKDLASKERRKLEGELQKSERSNKNNEAAVEKLKEDLKKEQKKGLIKDGQNQNEQAKLKKTIHKLHKLMLHIEDTSDNLQSTKDLPSSTVKLSSDHNSVSPKADSSVAVGIKEETERESESDEKIGVACSEIQPKTQAEMPQATISGSRKTLKRRQNRNKKKESKK